MFEQDRTDEAGDLRWRALGLVGGVTLLLAAHTVRQKGEDEFNPPHFGTPSHPEGAKPL
jgi:hypothetical protein